LSFPVQTTPNQLIEQLEVYILLLSNKYKQLPTATNTKSSPDHLKKEVLSVVAVILTGRMFKKDVTRLRIFHPKYTPALLLSILLLFYFLSSFFILVTCKAYVHSMGFAEWKIDK
jgi:hypothetical protein